MATYTDIYTDDITIIDNKKEFPFLKFEDTLTISENLSINGKFNLSFIDNIELTDTLVENNVIVMAFIEEIQLTDNAKLNAEITLKLSDNLNIDDYLTTTSMIGVESVEFNDYDTYCMNFKTNAFTKYQGLSFNSAVKFKGKYLISNGNGIYENIGQLDDNNTIPASFKTGLIRFTNSVKSRIDQAFLSIKNDGNMNIKVIGSDGESKIYTLTQENSILKEKRVIFGKGNGNGSARKCTYFQFEIDNDGSTDFELDSILLYKLDTSNIT